MEAAATLRAQGWTLEETYTLSQPFIVTGQAAWVDTWGAPRFGPGSLVRQHEGQDVFCEYGAPVLAVEDGVVELETGLLGGRVAKLYRPGGGFWYYAHFSDWPEDLASGSSVALGDVIGFCGNTGNAIHSAPHVHFGWYGPQGEAINPMSSLVRWLETAEREAVARVARLGFVEPDAPAVPVPVPVPVSTPNPVPIAAPVVVRELSHFDVFGVERERSAVPPSTPEAAGLCTLAWLTGVVVWRRRSTGRTPTTNGRGPDTFSVQRATSRGPTAVMPCCPAGSTFILAGPARQIR